MWGLVLAVLMMIVGLALTVYGSLLLVAIVVDRLELSD
jgi:hypothetical protein